MARTRGGREVKEARAVGGQISVAGGETEIAPEDWTVTKDQACAGDIENHSGDAHVAPPSVGGSAKANASEEHWNETSMLELSREISTPLTTTPPPKKKRTINAKARGILQSARGQAVSPKKKVRIDMTPPIIGDSDPSLEGLSGPLDSRLLSSLHSDSHLERDTIPPLVSESNSSLELCQSHLPFSDPLSGQTVLSCPPNPTQPILGPLDPTPPDSSLPPTDAPTPSPLPADPPTSAPTTLTPPATDLPGTDPPATEVSSWQDGGPRLAVLLRDYPTHVAEMIWRGTLQSIAAPPDLRVSDDLWRKILRAYSRPLKWDDIEQYKIDDPDSWWAIAQRSGLTRLDTMDFRGSDHVIITAFIEHWYPETNSFHFPWGEITITLHDVERILSLPIDGEPVVSQLEEIDFRSRVIEMLSISAQQYKSYATGIPVVDLQAQLIRMIRGEVNRGHTAAAYLLWLIGQSLFCDKSTNKVKLQYLHVLLVPDRTSTFAWGTAVLAFLYRQLGIASRHESKGIGGCVHIIRIWIWHYFRHFRDHSILNVDLLKDERAGVRDATDRRSGPKTPKRLEDIRRFLDTVRADEVCWQPWGHIDFDSPLYRISRYRGLIQCFDILEPYMPDRCLRQYFRVQVTPPDPIVPSKAARGTGPRNYEVTFDEHQLYWNQRYDHLINLGQYSLARYAWEVDPAYWDWFESVTHPYIDPRSPRQDRPREPASHPTAMVDITIRHQQLMGYATYALVGMPRDHGVRPYLEDILRILGDDHPSLPPPLSRPFRDSRYKASEGRGVGGCRE